MEVAIVVFGSKDSDYFTYNGDDGFKELRYVIHSKFKSIQAYIIVDHSTYNCLIWCTLAEPVFFKKCGIFFDKFRCKKQKKSSKETPFLHPSDTLNMDKINLSKKKDEESIDESQSMSMVFQNENKKSDSDSEEDDFENGDNKKEGTELEIIDTQKVENLISDAFANFNEQFNHMSIK